ncbi:MAG TPA: hypothetical protein V6D20_22940, partial [Candidatus Obscuribacterales bacterium]
MVLADKNYKAATSTYEFLSQFEEQENLKNSIEAGLYLIFALSQSYPIERVADFLNGSNFSIMEAYHELKSSYQITKFGFFKQGLTSLRSGLELGFLSTYWSIIGTNDKIFKDWLWAEEKTPFTEKVFKTL